MSTSHPEAIKEFPKSTQVFIKRLYNRVEGGRNALIIVVGATGSGKSLSVLQLLRGLYLYKYGREPKNEELIEHTVFKAKKFLEKMNNPNLRKKENWLWDECGIDVGHKSHATMQNRVVGWLAQTFRNLQQIVFFTTPSIGFIDASVRKLLHYYLEAVAIDTKKKICIMKPLEMQYNTRMDKIYYHNLTVPGEDGYLEEVEFMGVPKVSDELEKAYEEKKNLFTQDLNIRIQDTLDKLDQPHRPLTERQTKILELLEKGIKSTSKIAKEVGLPSTTVSQNFNYMRTKGINVDRYLKNKVVKNN